jgi:hypothetical protein
MPLPDNTFPMMTGVGPFGPLEMGGMFSVLKVRADQKPGDYSDPGPYRQPPGTQAREWTGNTTPGLNPGAALRASGPAAPANASAHKPSGHGHH